MITDGEKHTQATDDIIADFRDPEQSLVVRLEKLKWGIEGFADGINQSIKRLKQEKMHVPSQLFDVLRVNKAHQEFIDVVITHLKGEPQPELLSEADTKRWLEDIEGYLPKTEQDLLMAILKGAQHKYDTLRSHPLLELFKKLGSKSQNKLMAFAEKLDRRDNS